MAKYMLAYEVVGDSEVPAGAVALEAVADADAQMINALDGSHPLTQRGDVVPNSAAVEEFLRQFDEVVIYESGIFDESGNKYGILVSRIV